MLSLHNFKETIAAVILKRGEQYHVSGALSGIEQLEPGKWEAEIRGTEMYRVSIALNPNQEVTDYACDCPYDGGPVCKHVAATLYYLEQIENRSNQPVHNIADEKPLLSRVLHSKKKEEFIDFISQYARKNTLFRNEFEYFFTDKNEIPGKYDLLSFIHRLNSLPVTQIGKLDGILSDLDNHLYEVAEEVSDLLEKVSGMKPAERKQALTEITALHKQRDKLADIFDSMMDYDSHYMHRATSTFGGMYEEVEKLTEVLKE